MYLIIPYPKIPYRRMIPNLTFTTYGVPDSEYTISQSLGYDSDALSAINGRENAYQLALDVKASGYAGNMEVKESPYSHTIHNESIIGMVPEIEYEDELDEMTIKFRVADELTANELGTYAAVNSDLTGIRRFAIGYYSEELRMCLPIETEYNEQANEVYSTVSMQGTYCLIDMEKWFDMLGFDPEDLLDEGVQWGDDSACKYEAKNGEWSSSWGSNGHYYTVVGIEMTWAEAEAYCEGMGGHLATISTPGEMESIRRGISYSGQGGLWIGGYSTSNQDEYEWISGADFGYVGWRYGVNTWESNKCICLSSGDYRSCSWEMADPNEKKIFICELGGQESDRPGEYFSTTLKGVPLDFGAVVNDNTADYDNDGIPNNKEINFNVPNENYASATKISFYAVYLKHKDLTGSSFLDRFWTKEIRRKMDNTYFVCTDSDPISDDTDGDGIKDAVDIRPSYFDDFPDRFIELINDAIVLMDTVYQSYDGFYICMTPVGEIYNGLGCPDATFYSYDKNADGEYEQSEDIRNTYIDPDDYFLSRWYFYAVIDRDGECAYSMMKIKPYEFGDVPGVHIPFTSFEVPDFLYDSSMDDDEIAELDAELDRVSKCNIDGVPVDYSGIITKYFADPFSKGGYLVADLYVDLTVKQELNLSVITVGGPITADLKIPKMKLNDYSKALLKKYEKPFNGCNAIYDKTNNTIYIYDAHNLTKEEKMCVLACRSGNPSENSFVAEIVFHADWTLIHYNGRGYESAIKADLSAYEKKESIIDINEFIKDTVEDSYIEPEYKSETADLVIEQAVIHGER